MKNKVNEYYITTQYENHFVEHDLFFSIIDALNILRIPYKREFHTTFRRNGDDYDNVTYIHLYADFNTLFHIIKYYNEKEQTAHL